MENFNSSSIFDLIENGNIPQGANAKDFVTLSSAYKFKRERDKVVQ